MLSRFFDEGFWGVSVPVFGALSLREFIMTGCDLTACSLFLFAAVYGIGFTVVEGVGLWERGCDEL